jgi:uncharacterized protein with PQ loop repeat
MTTESKNTQIIGWLASLMAIAMYVSYIDQIKLNLSGHKGSVILPIVTTINCLLWTLYALSKNKKDYPILVCNIPGVVLGILTAVTALM